MSDKLQELFERFIKSFPKEEISPELASMCLAMAWRISLRVDPGMTRERWIERCNQMWGKS